MGGEVCIAIRKNGRIQKSLFHKGSVLVPWLKGFFTDPNAAMDFWNDREEAKLAPHDYGLVLIDFDTQWICDAQGFANAIDLHPTDVKNFREGLAEAARERGLDLMLFCNNPDPSKESCHLPITVTLSDPGGVNMEKDVENAIEVGNVKAIRRGLEPLSTFQFLRMRLPDGWTYEKHYAPEAGDSGGDWAGMLRSILERGFEIDGDELEKWRSFLVSRGSSDMPIVEAVGQWEAEKRAEQLKSSLHGASRTGPRPRL